MSDFGSQGLVIGKFVPFHNGHEHLILTAADQVDFLNVVVYDNGQWPISGSARAEAISEQMMLRGVRNVGVTVLSTPLYDDYEDANLWHAHDVALKAHLHHHATSHINYVFSSEEYGHTLADTFDAKHVLVDIDRATVPISGTEVRNDWHANWRKLPLATRLDVIPRIIVVGAESTGTTTLSLDLADSLNARWVPEYGREYTELWAEAHGGMEFLRWDNGDFEAIATVQNRLEENAAGSTKLYQPVVVADTDALATGIWRRRYMTSLGGPPALREHESHYRPIRDRALYLVTDHKGVPFEQDGIRDGEHLRAQMTAEFVKTLEAMHQPWALVSGTREERLAIAERLAYPLLLNHNA